MGSPSASSEFLPGGRRWDSRVVAKGTRLAFSGIHPASTQFSLSFGVAWVGEGDMQSLEDQSPLQPLQRCHWGIVSWSSPIGLNLSVAPQSCWVKFKCLGSTRPPPYLVWIWYPSPPLPLLLINSGDLCFCHSLNEPCPFWLLGLCSSAVAAPGMLFAWLLVTWFLVFLLFSATLSPPQGSLP